MDGNDFDSLTRKLGGLASRRQAVAGLVGAAIAATGLSAAAKNKGKSKKGKAHGFSVKDIRKGKGIGAAACGNAGCLGCSGGSVPDAVGACPGTEVPVCVPGTQDAQCGSGGANCTACSITTGGTDVCVANQNGNGGTCATPPPQCTDIGAFGTQCLQEVNGAATCQNRFGPNACGAAPNGSCLPACGTGQQCVADGSAFPGATCTSSTCAATCPNGCCAGPTDPFNPPGSCQPGDNIADCGSNGDICVSCFAVCGLEGSCVDGVCSCLRPPTCGAAQQPCCAGNTCLGSNVCNNGLCEAPTCNASNCTGCCQGSTCVTTTSDAQCGINGSTCVACQGKKHCKNGVCKKKHHRHH